MQFRHSACWCSVVQLFKGSDRFCCRGSQLVLPLQHCLLLSTASSEVLQNICSGTETNIMPRQLLKFDRLLLFRNSLLLRPACVVSLFVLTDGGWSALSILTLGRFYRAKHFNWDPSTPCALLFFLVAAIVVSISWSVIGAVLIFSVSVSGVWFKLYETVEVDWFSIPWKCSIHRWSCSHVVTRVFSDCRSLIHSNCSLHRLALAIFKRQKICEPLVK